MLLKEKLDVKNKKRSNIFNWRGQFTPEFVEYILGEFAESKDVIVDPFAGSGTVLQESTAKHLKVYGFEINPAAYAMCKFFTLSNVELRERYNLANKLAELIVKSISKYEGNLVCTDNKDSDFRRAYSSLISFAKDLLNVCDDSPSRILALNILFKVEKSRKLTILDATRKAFAQIRRALLELPYTDTTVAAFLCDARNVNTRLPEKADLVITSPPYINVFNYHQNYRSIMELMGFNLLKVAASEFGSNRKNRGNRFKTVIQYCLDIETTLHSIWEALNEAGRVVMIVGRESNVRGIPFYNGRIVHQIINNLKGFTTLKNHERAFSNKFGNKIVEDIIIFQKNRNSNNTFSTARSVAEHNLLNALKMSEGNIKRDIEEAISYLSIVEPSPLFDFRNGIINDKTTSSRQAISRHSESEV